MAINPANRNGGDRGEKISGATFSVTPARERDDFDRDVWSVLGLPVDAAGLSGAVLEIDLAVRDGRRFSFITPNVNWLVQSLRDPEARRRALDSDFSLADGAPLVLLARALGAPLRARAAGADLFDVLRKRSGFEGRRLRVFFFGGRDGAAEAAAKAVDAERGGVMSAGWLNPGHGDVDSMSVQTFINRINAAGPDFVVVSLGAEKGQAWIDRNRDRLAAPVVAHLGAVVDFVAGGVRRAPVWMQKTGLEWVWRIKEEPALWRRYVADGCAFILLLVTRFPRCYFGARPRANGEARAETQFSPEATTIRLGGVLSAGALDPVREAFRDASMCGGDVRLLFESVKAFDSAFLGLVLMLEKHVMRRGGRIILQGISRSQRAIFKANAMPYAVERAGDGRRPLTAARRNRRAKKDGIALQESVPEA
ncbi:MAG: WecB/TagA/CpsF family glycosyltransferase [Parvularculaceae bacterium]